MISGLCIFSYVLSSSYRSKYKSILLFFPLIFLYCVGKGGGQEREDKKRIHEEGKWTSTTIYEYFKSPHPSHQRGAGRGTRRQRRRGKTTFIHNHLHITLLTQRIHNTSIIHPSIYLTLLLTKQAIHLLAHPSLIPRQLRSLLGVSGNPFISLLESKFGQ